MLNEDIGMPVSSIQSGYQVLQQSQSMADEAANEIADITKSSGLEFNNVEIEQKQDQELNLDKPKPSYEEALTKLNQSNTYSQAGTSVVQRSNDIIGTILDTHI